MPSVSCECSQPPSLINTILYLLENLLEFLVVLTFIFGLVTLVDEVILRRRLKNRWKPEI